MDCATHVRARVDLPDAAYVFTETHLQIRDAAFDVIGIRHRVRIQTDDDLALRGFQGAIQRGGNATHGNIHHGNMQIRVGIGKAAISARVPSWNRRPQ